MARGDCTTLRDAQEYTWTQVSDGRPATYAVTDSDLDRRIEVGRDDMFVTLYAPRNPDDTWNSGMEQLDRRPMSQGAQAWVESSLQVE